MSWKTLMNQRGTTTINISTRCCLSQTPDRNANTLQRKICAENQFFTPLLISHYIGFNVRFNAKVTVSSCIVCCHWECRSVYNCYENSPIVCFQWKILQRVRSHSIRYNLHRRHIKRRVEHIQQVVVSSSNSLKLKYIAAKA